MDITSITIYIESNSNLVIIVIIFCTYKANNRIKSTFIESNMNNKAHVVLSFSCKLYNHSAADKSGICHGDETTASEEAVYCIMDYEKVRHKQNF